MARRAAARGGRLVPAALLGLFAYLYMVIGYGYYGGWVVLTQYVTCLPVINGRVQ